MRYKVFIALLVNFVACTVPTILSCMNNVNNKHTVSSSIMPPDYNTLALFEKIKDQAACCAHDQSDRNPYQLAWQSTVPHLPSYCYLYGHKQKQQESNEHIKYASYCIPCVKDVEENDDSFLPEGLYKGQYNNPQYTHTKEDAFEAIQTDHYLSKSATRYYDTFFALTKILHNASSKLEKYKQSQKDNPKLTHEYLNLKRHKVLNKLEQNIDTLKIDPHHLMYAGQDFDYLGVDLCMIELWADMMCLKDVLAPFYVAEKVALKSISSGVGKYRHILKHGSENWLAHIRHYESILEKTKVCRNLVKRNCYSVAKLQRDNPGAVKIFHGGYTTVGICRLVQKTILDISKCNLFSIDDIACIKCEKKDVYEIRLDSNYLKKMRLFLLKKLMPQLHSFSYDDNTLLKVSAKDIQSLSFRKRSNAKFKVRAKDIQSLSFRKRSNAKLPDADFFYYNVSLKRCQLSYFPHNALKAITSTRFKLKGHNLSENDKKNINNTYNHYMRKITHGATPFVVGVCCSFLAYAICASIAKCGSYVFGDVHKIDENSLIDCTRLLQELVKYYNPCAIKIAMEHFDNKDTGKYLILKTLLENVYRESFHLTSFKEVTDVEKLLDLMPDTFHHYNICVRSVPIIAEFASFLISFFVTLAISLSSFVGYPYANHIVIYE